MAESAAARAEESDEALVGKVISGDVDAFEILYERYLPRVYGFVRKRLRNRADVDESVQDVFIAVFSSLDSYRGDSPLAAWVLGIARRTVANRFKKKRHPTIPLELGEEPENLDLAAGPMLQRAATPHEQYECRERIRQIETTAHQLSKDQWQLFEMHHLKHHSISEIASATHKSEDAVKSNLYRVRKVLLAP